MQTAIAGGVTRSPFDAGMPERILAGESDPLTEVMRAWAGGALGGAIAGLGALADEAQRASLLSRLALEDFKRGGTPGAAERLVAASEGALERHPGDDPWPAVAYATGVAALVGEVPARMRDCALRAVQDVRARSADPDALVALAGPMTALRYVVPVPDEEIGSLARSALALSPYHSGALRLWAEHVAGHPVREPGALARAYADVADTHALTQAECDASVTDVHDIGDALLRARIAMAARDPGGAASACDAAGEGEAWVPRVRSRIALDLGRVEEAQRIASDDEPWAIVMVALCALARDTNAPVDVGRLVRAARQGRPVDAAELAAALAPNHDETARRVLAGGLSAYPGSEALRSSFTSLLKGRLKPRTAARRCSESSRNTPARPVLAESGVAGYTGLEM